MTFWSESGDELPRGRFLEVPGLATTAVSLVVGRIEALGLRAAMDKTEALLFDGPRRSPRPGVSIVISQLGPRNGSGQDEVCGMNRRGDTLCS